MRCRGRPIVNRERDRRIFAHVEADLREGLSLRRAYAKEAKAGRFGAMSKRTVESAYLKERRHRRQHQHRRPTLSWIAAKHVERNRRFFAAVTERHTQFFAAVTERHTQFFAAAVEASDLFRHLR